MTGDAASLLADGAVRQVLELLDRDGEKARIVGGAVRNRLLERPVHEYDIATTATPDITIARANKAKLRAIPTGIAHGTVTLIVKGMPFEVTTLREDVETDGRHAIIRFGRDFALDARRRDFTINALSVGLDGVLHDYTDGLADIGAGRVRFIGDARQRIREDFLRVLRFFRFSADYAEGPLEAEGLSASIGERAGLARLSRERVRQELLKLLVARRAPAIVAEMSEAGLLGPLLQGVPRPARLAKLVAILSMASPATNDPILHLAALAVVVSEDAVRLREALRLSNQEALRLERAAAALVGLPGAGQPPGPGQLRAMLFEAGRQGACDALRLAHADSGAEVADPFWNAALHFLRDTPEPRLPFAGADLMARGFTGGPALGEALKVLQGKWIRAGFPQEPHILAALMDEVTGALTPPNVVPKSR